MSRFIQGNCVHIMSGFPDIGANEQIVYVLEDLIKSKLPRKTPISFHLVSSKLIGDQLDRGLSEFRWQGKHADKFNRITRAYYQRAAQQQFNSPTGLPLTLRDYRDRRAGEQGQPRRVLPCPLVQISADVLAQHNHINGLSAGRRHGHWVSV